MPQGGDGSDTVGPGGMHFPGSRRRDSPNGDDGQFQLDDLVHQIWAHAGVAGMRGSGIDAPDHEEICAFADRDGGLLLVVNRASDPSLCQYPASIGRAHITMPELNPLGAHANGDVGSSAYQHGRFRWARQRYQSARGGGKKGRTLTPGPGM